MKVKYSPYAYKPPFPPAPPVVLPPPDFKANQLLTDDETQTHWRKQFNAPLSEKLIASDFHCSMLDYKRGIFKARVFVSTNYLAIKPINPPKAENKLSHFIIGMGHIASWSRAVKRNIQQPPYVKVKTYKTDKQHPDSLHIYSTDLRLHLLFDFENSSYEQFCYIFSSAWRSSPAGIAAATASSLTAGAIGTFLNSLPPKTTPLNTSTTNTSHHSKKIRHHHHHHHNHNHHKKRDREEHKQSTVKKPADSTVSAVITKLQPAVCVESATTTTTAAAAAVMMEPSTKTNETDPTAVPVLQECEPQVNGTKDDIIADLQIHNYDLEEEVKQLKEKLGKMEETMEAKLAIKGKINLSQESMISNLQRQLNRALDELNSAKFELQQKTEEIQEKQQYIDQLETEQGIPTKLNEPNKTTSYPLHQEEPIPKLLDKSDNDHKSKCDSEKEINELKSLVSVLIQSLEQERLNKKKLESQIEQINRGSFHQLDQETDLRNQKKTSLASPPSAITSSPRGTPIRSSSFYTKWNEVQLRESAEKKRILEEKRKLEEERRRFLPTPTNK